MASPQKENGYVPIANEIIEKLSRYRISGQEFQVLFVVLRKTWGWNKKQDEISLSQFVLATEMKRCQVVRAIKKLVSKKILSSIKEDTTFANSYRFNKDFDQWSASIKKDTGGIKRDTRVVSKRIPKVVSIKIHTKDTSKDTNTKDIQEELISDVIKLFEVINPACKKYYGNITQRGAVSSLITTYGFERIKSVIERTLPKTNLLEYFPNITTPLQLWEKWASLEAMIVKKKSEKKINSVAFT